MHKIQQLPVSVLCLASVFNFAYCVLMINNGLATATLKIEKLMRVWSSLEYYMNIFYVKPSI